MSELLSLFLEQTVTPESRQRLYRVYQVLVDVGSPNVENVENLLSEEVDDSTQQLDAVITLLETCLKEALQQFGIVTNPETYIGDRAEILHHVANTLDNYADYNAVLKILESDLSEVETLSDILALVTEWDSETISPMLDEVSPSLIDRLETLYTRQAESVSEIPEDSEPMADFTRNRVKATLTQDVGIGGVCLELVRSGIKLGRSLDTYLSSTIDQILDEADNRRVAEVLLAICLMTNNHHTDFPQLISAVLESQTFEANRISTIMTEVDSRLKRLESLGVFQ